MALFGSIDHLSSVLQADPRFAPGFAYIRRCLAADSPESDRLRGMADGAVEEIRLEAGSVTFDQVYRTRPRADCFFESHRKYIDIQFVLAGEEVIDVMPIRALAETDAYREDKDLIKYADATACSRLRLRAGEAAIFFPEDGHMPGQFADAPGLVRKTVVKVPVG
jgi:biofilm protein TabA